jgi:hypothetical protein
MPVDFRRRISVASNAIQTTVDQIVWRIDVTSAISMLSLVLETSNIPSTVNNILW